MGFDWIALAGNFLLFALVFGMSATVDIRSLKVQMRNTKAILTGVFCQFVVLPLLGFLVTSTLDLEPAMGVTLLVVTSSPGGSYSNWWCSMFNADLALSVTMTAISTILSIFMLPLNLLLYTRFSYERDIVHNLDWPMLFAALAIVISAIALGLYCSSRFDSIRFHKIANQIGNVAGLFLIIFSATMTNTGSSDTKIWSRHWTFYVGVMIPCLGGLVLANIISTGLRLARPERVTVAIECCYQNVGIATSLALTMFDGNQLNEAMGIPFFYGVMEAALVGIYCLGAWKCGWTKAPSHEKFCTVLLTSYEVLAMELRELDGIEVSISESDETIPEKHEGSILQTYINMDHWFGWGTTGEEQKQEEEEQAQKEEQNLSERSVSV